MPLNCNIYKRVCCGFGYSHFKATQWKICLLCFWARITVGLLSALIKPDAPSSCLSDLSTVTILSSVYTPSWPTSQQDKWHNSLEFDKERFDEKTKSKWKSIIKLNHNLWGFIFCRLKIFFKYAKFLWPLKLLVRSSKADCISRHWLLIKKGEAKGVVAVYFRNKLNVSSQEMTKLTESESCEVDLQTHHYRAHIIKDSSQPGHFLITLLPSGRRHETIKTRTKIKGSFYTRTAEMLNSTVLKLVFFSSFIS